jgi:hypothetical protein
MAMRQIDRIAGLVVMGFFCGLLLGAPVCATEIIRLNLDNADALGTVVSSDHRIKFEGKSSIRVLTEKPLN